MPSPTSRRRTGLVLAAAATALTVAVGTSAAATPAAPPSGPATTAEAPSTPVRIVTPNGLLMSYVVNAAHTDGRDFAAIEGAITKSGGVVVQAWPQIGVLVAQSERAVFRTKVAERAGGAVTSIAPTRTVAVSEGTPAGVATPWTSSAARAGAAVTKADSEDASATVVADPRESEQWDMALIRAQAAHRTTDGSRSVVVGILDSGIDPDHPDLQANIDVADSVNCTDAGRPDRSATGWYPTTSSHGTHVAGTVAAVRNGIGVVGVAPGVQVASVKVVNDDGFIYPEYAICGFMWAGQRGMDVTNSSYYIDPFEFYCGDQPEQAAPLEAVRRAVAWSTSKGVVHAAAAGNSAVDLGHKTSDGGSPDDGTPVSRRLNSTCKDIPTELPGVLTVSSIAQGPDGSTAVADASLSSFSNRGKGIIDVAAPGSSILSTIDGGGYARYSGTSMASPHVAGVLALLKSTHPTWTPAQLESAVRDQATPKACTSGTPACLGTPADSSFFGQGVVNANRAVTP